MKRLVLAIALALLLVLPLGVPAAPRARQCPKLVVSCPDTILAGQPATFTASIDSVPADAKPTYKWIVSAGTISSGQGTSAVTVDTTGLPGNSSVTATVDVGGLPESCANSASCTSGIPLVIFHDKVDEYGDINFEDEKARLDNYAIELQNDPEFVGYIVAYGGRRSRRGEALRRAERAKRYITGVRGVAPARVVTIDGGYREELTVELKLRHKSRRPPEPAPTVDPSEVQFIRAVPKRRARRR
ncbi:MAG TPA: hypothetical protein VN282_09765 [Pyrinomonadaceae bacterium]|nr:hypothetical protein [Pyrinomonadaceae bacterium]